MANSQIDIKRLSFPNADAQLLLGLKGDKGDTGDQGKKGDTGDTGNGIASITHTGTSGAVKTYTITFTDGTSQTYDVTDGEVTTEQMNTAIDNAVTDLKSDMNRVGDFNTLNLIDPSTIQLGKYCNNTNLIPIDSTSYNLVVVPVKAGATYTLKYGDYNYILSAIGRTPRFVCFANSQGQGGFDVLDYGSTSIDSSFTVPSGAAYAYITTFSDYGNKLILVEGDYDGTSTPYIPYGPVFESKLTINDIVNYCVLGKNLADISTATDGWLAQDASIVSSDSYKTTDYIPVKANTTYTVSPRLRMYGLYGSLKNFKTYDNTVRNSAYQITPTEDGFLRVTYYVDDAVMVEEGSTATEYEPYKRTLSTGYLLNDEQIEQVEGVIGFSQDELYNKKWTVCGDSFTYGGYSPMNTLDDGKYAGARKVYPYYIGNRTGINIVDFSAGGRTLAYPADGSFHNSLTDPNADCYYQNIPSDTDYITIYLGINDSHHEHGTVGDGEDPTGIIPLGTIDDNTTATYYGAWNVVLSWLIENRPFSHIGIIVSNGCDREAYRTAQIEIARKYGIPFIDLNGDDRTPVMIRSLNPNIAASVKTAITQKQAVDYPSNTHPNDEAHEYESYFIENFLRTI